jgi:exonuclease
VLDSETTRLYGSFAVELAVVAVDGTVLVDTVNPQVPIPEEVTGIHGITDAMVAAAPTFGEAARAVRRAPAKINPFWDFWWLLEYHFPTPQTIPGPNPDNPFPLSKPPVRRPSIQYEVWNWVSWGVDVDGGGPTGRGPVPPWNPFVRELAAGFALAELANLVSPALRESVNRLAAEQVEIASREIAGQMLTPERLDSEKGPVRAAPVVHPRPRTALVTPAGAASHSSIESSRPEADRGSR